MKPPYEINTEILNLVTALAARVGEAQAFHLDRPAPQLRRENKIKTISATLQIEGNTLSIEQVTSILDNKRVVGPARDIREVENAIQVYDSLRDLQPSSEKSFLKAHGMLMQGLAKDAGSYRSGSVGIMKGKKLAHLAPPAKQVPLLMKDIFSYIRSSNETALILGCVVHYEIEFIHPFSDGNGRMGRLWQTLILSRQFPIFEYLPVESIIARHQKEYYKALEQSDKSGKSNPFILFMLEVLNESLSEMLQFRGKVMSEKERLDYFTSLRLTSFSRKEYMDVFRNISSATASRDLFNAVQAGIFRKEGDKNSARYFIVKE